MAAILGYLVLQTQKRLETVQSELHRVSEDAAQTQATVVELKQIAAALTRELKKN